jgi:hypothetical protein
MQRHCAQIVVGRLAGEGFTEGVGEGQGETI